MKRWNQHKREWEDVPPFPTSRGSEGYRGGKSGARKAIEIVVGLIAVAVVLGTLANILK